MTTIAGIVIGQDENVIRKLRPVIFAFGKYYELAGLYLLSAVLWIAANVYGGATFAGPWDYELGAYWVILILPALAAGVLWISKQPLVYAILAGIAGTVATAWTLSTTVTIPSLLGFSATTMTPATVLPLTLGAAAVIAFIFIQAYRRGHRYHPREDLLGT